MAKIESVGNGFIQIDNVLYNLQQFKTITKYELGYDEDPAGKIAYAIRTTPLLRSDQEVELGTVGLTDITSYTKDEQHSWEQDFAEIIKALKS